MVLTVSPTPILWERSRIPETGHYCFVCLLGNAADPAPGPADLASWDDYVRFIRDNNNVAWRNFNTETRRVLPVAPFGKHVMAGVRLPAKLCAKCALEVAVPEGALEASDYAVAIRQLYKTAEVGRITWKLTLRC